MRIIYSKKPGCFCFRPLIGKINKTIKNTVIKILIGKLHLSLLVRYNRRVAIALRIWFIVFSFVVFYWNFWCISCLSLHLHCCVCYSMNSHPWMTSSSCGGISWVWPVWLSPLTKDTFSVAPKTVASSSVSQTQMIYNESMNLSNAHYSICLFTGVHWMM